MESEDYFSGVSQSLLNIQTSIQTFLEAKLSPQTLQVHAFLFLCTNIYI